MGKVTATVEGGNLRRRPYYSFSSSSGRRMLFFGYHPKEDARVVTHEPCGDLHHGDSSDISSQLPGLL
jgi:hypothetical protein